MLTEHVGHTRVRCPVAIKFLKMDRRLSTPKKMNGGPVRTKKNEPRYCGCCGFCGYCGFCCCCQFCCPICSSTCTQSRLLLCVHRLCTQCLSYGDRMPQTLRLTKKRPQKPRPQKPGILNMMTMMTRNRNPGTKNPRVLPQAVPGRKMSLVAGRWHPWREVVRRSLHR